MSALISLSVWLGIYLKVLVSRFGGSLVFLGFFPFLPRYLGVGFGADGVALNTKRLLLLSFFALLVYRYINGKYPRLRYMNKQLVLIASLLIAYYSTSFLAAIYAGELKFGIYRYVEDLLYLIVGGVIGWHLAVSKNGIKQMCIYAFYVPLIFCTIAVVLEMLQGYPLLSKIMPVDSNLVIGGKGHEFFDSRYRDGRYRAKALFDGPLMLAEYLTYAFTAIMFGYYAKILKFSQASFLIVCTFICVYSTGSRAALVIIPVTVLIALACFLFRRSKRVGRVLVSLFSVAGVGLLSFGVYQLVAGLELVDNFSVIESATERSTYGRLLQYKIVSGLMAESPIFGYGYKRHYADAFEALHTIDNYYLVLAIQAGLVGVFCFICSQILAWRQALKSTFSLEKSSFFLGVWFLTFFVSFALFKLFVTSPGNNIYWIVMVTLAILKYDNYQYSSKN